MGCITYGEPFWGGTSKFAAYFDVHVFAFQPNQLTVPAHVFNWRENILPWQDAVSAFAPTLALQAVLSDGADSLLGSALAGSQRFVGSSASGSAFSKQLA